MLELDESGFPRLQDGRYLKLAPKERAVLAQLLQSGEKVVSKSDFAATAWSGGEMTDEGLARSISRIRKVLSPHGAKVASEYGTGYRLVMSGAAAQARRPSRQDTDALAHARQLLIQRTPATISRCIELTRTLCAQSPRLLDARVVLVEALAVAILWGQVQTRPAVAEGMQILDMCVDGLSDFPGAHACRGVLLDLAWRFREAEVHFNRALAREPESVDVLLAFGRHLLCMDRCEEAVQVLRRVLNLSPHTLHARMNLARALIQGGRPGDAVAEVRAAQSDHPSTPVLQAFALAIEAMAEPRPELETIARRMTEGTDAPPFAWSVLAFVQSRLGRREATLDIVETVLLCSSMDTGQRALYAAPLAAIGEYDRAAALLEAAAEERCGILGIVLRDPAHAHWLYEHPAGRRLITLVFGESDFETGPRERRLGEQGAPRHRAHPRCQLVAVRSDRPPFSEVRGAEPMPFTSVASDASKGK
ncbi:tetratricopeptide repeat protein [Paucibacter sp. R3-3]|uniref:Tetratricopeptide repeat protein n=1 Tax=Roseateles agri TaxID=3098619 RepID=A0ABU5DRX6_9BURK|nr:tetratricopeptide repeat protein [Paucibacter sp. R3-3]MDY0749076.1 tetratricopeptide repeat protein [Paucibacter sp. R3-3]